MSKKFIAGQSARILEGFSHNGKTMLQVARELRVERANVCWAVHDLREEGRIHLVRRGNCPISKSRAGYYTTNPNGWLYHIGRNTAVLKELNDDEMIDVCSAVKSYYFNDYDSSRTIVPPAVQEFWNTTMKPLIDKEVQK